ncbi:MAG: N-acetyltransferase [Ruminococcus sp.]|nr:N-acetyltransferase [Ruminococcus sp.]
MIRLIDNQNDLDRDMLVKTLSGKKILSYLKAYGTDYDFCRFYKLEYDIGCGFMFMINSTLIICSDYDLPTDEILSFIHMNIPFRIEGSQQILKKLSIDNYQVLNRTVFEMLPDEKTAEFNEQFVNFNPDLDDVYKILSEGFPNIADYGLWITDTSHRCRHGVSRVFTYKECTTASIVFDIENTVLIGQVATKIESRGSGYARDFLKWLAAFLNQFNKRAYLLALDIRVSYYLEIGFREVEKEIVLERIDIEKESMQKGRLNNESELK